MIKYSIYTLLLVGVQRGREGVAGLRRGGGAAALGGAAAARLHPAGRGEGSGPSVHRGSHHGRRSVQQRLGGDCHPCYIAAFRGPLATASKLHLSDVAGYVDRDTGLDMDHECVRTDGLAPRYRASLAHILPDYGCLILSPANIWSKDPATFQLDGAIVDTVFSFQRSREGDVK